MDTDLRDEIRMMLSDERHAIMERIKDEIDQAIQQERERIATALEAVDAKYQPNYGPTVTPPKLDWERIASEIADRIRESIF